MVFEGRKSLFIEIFGDYPLIRILDFLIENRVFDYSRKDIAKLSGISYNTLKELFDKLIENELIIKTRKVGKSDMFQLNKSNPVSLKLLEIDRSLMISVIRRTDEEEKLEKQETPIET